MLPFVPVLLGLGIATAAYRAGSKRSMKGVLTPARRMLYETALTQDSPPWTVAQLLGLAAQMEAEGLDGHGAVLRKRARLRGLPEATKAARRQVVAQLLTSNDPQKVRLAADAFEAESATGTAETLRDYAVGLEAAALQAASMPPAASPAPTATPTPSPSPSTNGAPPAPAPPVSTPSVSASS